MITCRRSARGVSMVEFTVALPVVTLLTLGTIEGAVLMHTKSAINHAALEAGREGTVSNASVGAIKRGLARGLATVYGGGSDVASVRAAQARALADINAGYLTVELLNPTRETFIDFGVDLPNGARAIPNDNLAYRPRIVGTASGQTIHDANLLKLRVTYWHELRMPLARKAVTAVLQLFDPDPARQAMYRLGRIAVVSQATVRMQSPAYEHPEIVSAHGVRRAGADPMTAPKPNAGLSGNATGFQPVSLTRFNSTGEATRETGGGTPALQAEAISGDFCTPNVDLVLQRAADAAGEDKGSVGRPR